MRAPVLRTCLFAALCLIPSKAEAATIRVPGDQPTIQAGLVAAAPGDTVLVAPGTYSGAGNRDLDFGGKDLVLRSESGAETTIIDSGGSEVDPHRALIFRGGVTASSVVEGFFLRGGWGPIVVIIYDRSVAGAILCADGASPTIRKCIFADNVAGDYGGAVACLDGAAPILDACVFRGNSAVWGGGLYCSASSPVVSSCEFVQNRAGYAGAGIACWYYSSPQITFSVFDSNQVLGGSPGDSSAHGGGIYCGDHSSPAIGDCEFTSNAAGPRSGHGDTGGGIVCWYYCSPTMSRCKFRTNVAEKGGAVHSERSSPVITACTFEGNLALDRGGAVYFDFDSDGVGSISDCSFLSNTAGAGFPTAYGGGAICFRHSSPWIAHCLFSGNECYDGGAMYCSGHASPRVAESVFAANRATRGGVLFCSNNSSPHLVQCTLAGNRADWYGAGLYSEIDSAPSFEACIVAFSTEGEAMYCSQEYYGTPDPLVSCTDIFGNPDGDWIGCIAAQAGRDGNFSADPLFCDLAGGDLTLHVDSPCLPGGHEPGPDCDLIGALGLGCGGPTSSTPTTWGLVKARFADPLR